MVFDSKRFFSPFDFLQASLIPLVLGNVLARLVLSQATPELRSPSLCSLLTHLPPQNPAQILNKPFQNGPPLNLLGTTVLSPLSVLPTLPIPLLSLHMALADRCAFAQAVPLALELFFSSGLLFPRFFL